MPLPLIPIGVGAGLGLLGSIFGPKSQTSTTDISPEMQRYRTQILNAGFGMAGRPLSFYGVPGYSAPSGFGAGAGSGPTTGFFGSNPSYLSKFPGAGLNYQDQPFQPPPTFGAGQDPWVAAPDQRYTDMFMNPYEKNVIGGIQSDYDRQRTNLGLSVNDLATKAGAFGGSRSAVLQAQGLRDIGQNEGNQIGAFRYAGYNNALNQGMGLHQNEIDAARSRFDMARNYPMQQLGFMQQLFGSMPMGGTSTIPMNNNPWLGLLGGGLAAGSVFGAGGH